MRVRPVRPNIYLPVVRFGVADSDWFSVLLISCAGYLVPVPLGPYGLLRAAANVDLAVSNCREHRLLQLHSHRSQALLA